MTEHAHINSELSNERALKWSFAIISIFMVVEGVGGYISNSLALLADAGHMLTDAAALGMAWMAFVVGRKPPDKQHSYGHQRYQVIAAFVNGLLLIAMTMWIVVEAFERFNDPQPIKINIMMSIAVIGLIVNLITFKMLHTGSHDNLNIRGAILHVLGDLLGSVAAILAAASIYLFNWLWMDPLLSLIVAGLIVRSGVSLIGDSLHILLEGVPKHINVKQVKKHLEHKFQDIENVHHVHTWSLIDDEVLMTLHVKVFQLECVDALLKSIHEELEHAFNITHATIQIEKEYCSSELEQH